MADKTTKPEDVIVPELFTQYVLEETTEKSEIVASGAVENNALLDNMISGGGAVTFTMPRWEDLGGASDVFTAEKGSQTEKVGSHPEIGVKLLREKSWGFHDLAHAFAADDPARDFAARVGRWWRRDEKRNLMAILKGVIASSDLADHVLDITGGASTKVDAKQILDTKQLMGDAADDLSLIYMHSAVFTELQKQQLIVYQQATDANIKLATYLGYNVICDDSAPIASSGGTKGVYTVTLGGTITADDTVTVAGVTVTVEAGDDLAAVATKLKNALAANSLVSAVYVPTVASNVVTLTQVVAGTGAQPSASVSSEATITATAATTTEGVKGTDVFTTFLLSRGCIQRGIGTPPGFVGTEMERKADIATTKIFTRQSKILHPKGMSWNARPTDLTYETPTDLELENGSYWAKAASELKMIGICALKHTL